MTSFADRVADLVIGRFLTLPLKNKPIINADGVRGWVPLSGIVLSKGDTDTECVSLATGMKCLPSYKVPFARGSVLHDWHAEVLAIRGFNHLLIKECHRLAQSHGSQSSYVRRRAESQLSDSGGLQPFTIHDDLKIHMYCSETPCGDASMELTMSAQQDPTPWTRPMSKSEEEDPAVLLNGRAYFSELGVVRRKPSRADSPATLSKSCSDKLALKQCTSLLSTAATVLISPENAYLDTLILPASRFVPSACERAFGAMGRMQSVAGKRWSGGYSYRPFKINSTSREFEYSNCGAIEAGLKSKPLNISALWTSHLQETLINGVLQGRKQADPKGGSAVCRLKLSHLVLSTLACLALPALAQVVASPRYADLKAAEALQDRKQVKKEATSVALRGWLPNVADDFDIHIE